MTRASAIGLAEAPSPRWRSSAAARAGTMRATSDVAQTIARARARLRAVRVVDINALRALAPLPRAPVPRPSRPPAPHVAPPLEPQAQRTLASGRADRARPAVSGHPMREHRRRQAANGRQMDRPDSTHDAARRRHDTVLRASEEPIRARRPLESVKRLDEPRGIHAPPHTHTCAGRTPA
jgi:hypothetical protein